MKIYGDNQSQRIQDDTLQMNRTIRMNNINLFGIGSLTFPGETFTGPSRVYTNIMMRITNENINVYHILGSITRAVNNLTLTRMISESPFHNITLITTGRARKIINQTNLNHKNIFWISGISKKISWAIKMKSRNPNNLKIIYTAHGLISRESKLGYDYDYWYHEAERAIFQHADLCTFVSHRLASMAIEDYGIDKSRINVRPNGIDESFLNVPVKENDYKKTGDRKIILAITNINKVKGLEFLFEAISKIQRSDIVCIILGQVHDSSYYQRLISRFHDLINAKKIIMISDKINDSRLVRLYDSCMISILPSMYEPFGLVALEAMSRGKPVIVSDRVGILDFLHPDNDIISIPFGDSEGLALKIEELMNNEEKRLTIGRNGRISAFNFAWKAIASKYESLFIDI